MYSTAGRLYEFAWPQATEWTKIPPCPARSTWVPYCPQDGPIRGCHLRLLLSVKLPVGVGVPGKPTDTLIVLTGIVLAESA